MERKISEETCKEFNDKIKEAFNDIGPVNITNYSKWMLEQLGKVMQIPPNIALSKYDTSWSAARCSILHSRWEKSVDEFRRTPNEQNSLIGLA